MKSNFLLLQNIPQQYNNYDCGVFTCMYAEAVCQGRETFDFTQKDMKNCRQKIADAIMFSAVSVAEIESAAPITVPTATVSGGPSRKEFFVAASASFHQATLNVFPHNNINSQCTAIATYALMALTLKKKYDIDSKLLDEIIIKGDEYYQLCFAALGPHPPSTHLNVEELLPIPFQNTLVKFEIDDIAAGFFNDKDATGQLRDGIGKCIDLNELSCGFLFIGEGKTLSFRVVVGCGTNLLMLFNSHSVDEDNKNSPHDSPNSRARLFLCSDATALANLLLTNSSWSPAAWQLVKINFQQR